MTVTNAIGNTTWTVTNQYVVGGSTVAGVSVVNVLASGTLAVTNGGLAQLIVGLNSKGTFTLNGGTLLVDQLLVTNNYLNVTNSYFNFTGGTFVSIANGSTTPLSSMSVQGGGQSVVIKYNAANSWWTTP